MATTFEKRAPEPVRMDQGSSSNNLQERFPVTLSGGSSLAQMLKEMVRESAAKHMPQSM